MIDRGAGRDGADRGVLSGDVEGTARVTAGGGALGTGTGGGDVRAGSGARDAPGGGTGRTARGGGADPLGPA